MKKIQSQAQHRNYLLCTLTRGRCDTFMDNNHNLSPAGKIKEALRWILWSNLPTFQDSTFHLHPNVLVPFAFTSLKIVIEKAFMLRTTAMTEKSLMRGLFCSVLFCSSPQGVENILEMLRNTSCLANKHCPLLEKCSLLAWEPSSQQICLYSKRAQY